MPRRGIPTCRSVSILHRPQPPSPLTGRRGRRGGGEEMPCVEPIICEQAFGFRGGSPTTAPRPPPATAWRICRQALVFREACPPRRPGRRPQPPGEFEWPPYRKLGGFRKGLSQSNAKKLRRDWAGKSAGLVSRPSPPCSRSYPSGKSSPWPAPRDKRPASSLCRSRPASYRVWGATR